MPLVRQAAGVALGARQVVKDLGRTQEIAEVLARHGLGWLVANIDVPGVGLLRRVLPDEHRESPTPERLTAVLRDLGPTFVKVGQILSTRPDFVPAAYTEAFQTLQDAVNPFPWEDVRAQIEQGLGGPPEMLFEHFDPEPLAAASIAQVHRARLKTGEEVAVKVQRPAIRRKIHTDLSILEFLSRQIEAQIPEARVLDLPGVVGVLRRSLAEETDFNSEARSTEQFARNFADDPHIVVPHVFLALTCSEVLTLQYLDGVKIGEAREAGYDMKLVGERYLAAAFKMLLEDGDFHGDLHPGNVLVLPGERIGLLDFGMVGRLTEENRADLVAIFFALQRRDYRTIARVYWELAIKPEHVDYDAWEADVQELMHRQFTGRSMSEIQIADFLAELLAGAHRHRVRTSPAYTMFFKALITTEGLAKMLIPEVDPLTEMMPYVERMARQQYAPEKLREELFYYLNSFRYTFRRLPLIAGQLMGDMQQGRARLRTVSELHPDDRARQERMVNRMAVAFSFAGLVIASSIALSASGPKLLGMPAPATIGYGLSAVLLWGLLSAIWRSRKL